MNILTVDLEDWFHLLGIEQLASPREWVHFEPRFRESTDFILGVLQKYNLRCHFFCVGWIAETYPDVIRRISDAGFEIGSHTNHHLLLNESPIEIVVQDIRKSIETISHVTGKAVTSFRAPGFSITQQNLWLIELLIEMGIKYDSSLVFGHHSHGGMKNREQILEPFYIDTAVGSLLELPIICGNLFNRSVVYSGGGYFRFFPLWLINKLEKERYNMYYFHPRDFDYLQPRLKLSPLRYFKSYYGLKSSKFKFEKLIMSRKFNDISDYVDGLNTKVLKRFNVNDLT